MKAVTDFIKSNPVVLVSALAVVLALAFLFLFVHSDGKTFVSDVQKRKDKLAEIDRLMKTRVEFPGPKHDDPPVVVTTAVNKATIDKLTEVYAKMKSQYDMVTKGVSDHNKAGHEPMMEGLLPKPVSPEAGPYTAKDEYQKALRAMLNRPTALDGSAPRLNAGAPPVAKEFLDEIQKVEDKFLASFIPKRDVAALSADDQKRLAKLKRNKALDLVTDNARRMYIYADTDPKSPDYPFHVLPWSEGGAKPTMIDIWEGQMNVWIQQDIVEAIAIANDPRDKDGSPIRDFSVMTAPVKHLLSIRVRDGLVGINSMGGVNQMAAEAAHRPGGERIPVRPGVRPGVSNDPFANAEVTKAMVDEIANHDPNKRLPEMFNVVPSGRVSNAIYDVRHATVELIVDFNQMPKLFEAIGKVNFMTVLNVSVTDVDEYAELEKGLVYGDADCVRVRMLIETIWLRDWTRPLMPVEFKERYGIKEPTVAGAATTPATPSSTPAP